MAFYSNKIEKQTFLLVFITDFTFILRLIFYVVLKALKEIKKNSATNFKDNNHTQKEKEKIIVQIIHRMSNVPMRTFSLFPLN